MDQFVTQLRPAAAGGRIAHVMAHAGRPRRENRDVGAPFPLEFKLRAFRLSRIWSSVIAGPFTAWESAKPAIWLLRYSSKALGAVV